MLDSTSHKKTMLALALTALVSIHLPLVAGENTGHYQEQVNADYHGDFLNLNQITTTLSSDVETFEICGRGAEGGDGCLDVNPSHHYFRVIDSSENQIGNQHHVVLENTGMYSWLRLQVDLCWSHNKATVPIMDNDGTTIVSYETTHGLLCKDQGKFYKEEKMVLPVYFLRSDTYFVKVSGIAGEGDDRTSIKVSRSLVANSNNDRIEPESILSGELYKRKVCQNGCQDGVEDPVDVFSLFAHAGDKLQIQIRSRGHEGVCEDGWFDSNEYKVQFYWREARRMATHQDPVMIHMDESQCTNPHTMNYRMEQTGEMWFYFMAKGNEEDKTSTSYSLKVNFDHSTREWGSDFDGDGWSDWDEINCATDYESVDSEPDDTDGDTICDPRDPDDDNDGTADIYDDCPHSTGVDWDMDGCDDSEDDDDDDDGWKDEFDVCPLSNMTFVRKGADTDVDGCYDEEDPDADGDGHPNESDAFPLVASQWNDSDGDGFGDKSQGFEADACPNQWGNSTEDRFGCHDRDGDGWSDLNDAFVNDSSQHIDSDGDGFGDHGFGINPDYCILQPGNSTVVPFLGCPDNDEDGLADLADPCPTGQSCWKGLLSNQFIPSSHATELAALFILFLLLVTRFRRPKGYDPRRATGVLGLTREEQGIMRSLVSQINRQNNQRIESKYFNGEFKLDDLKVAQLKELLKTLNLPVAGKKSDLVERLRMAVDTAEEPLEELRVAQLKEQLHALKLPIEGKKSELVNRLRSAINSGEKPLEGLKVNQLKDHLRSLNLTVSGTRSELEQRLLEAINGSDG